MTWIAVFLLVALCFGFAVVAFRLNKGLWTSLLAALSMGMAGYALQASPGMPSAPKSSELSETRAMFDIVEARHAMLAESERSSADFVLVADAMARQGQYDDAANILRGVTAANPQDFDAWLALGNALVEHADGVLTAPALYAYRQAAMLKPRHLAPNYFLGVTLIRQGRMMEARQVWAESLAAAEDDAVGREAMAERLLRLEEMLGQFATPQPETPTE